MPRKMNCVVLVKPTNTTLIEIAGSNELPYSQFLKKLWIYWKANGLNRVEKIAK